MTSILAPLLPFLGAAFILISAHSLQKRHYKAVDCGPDKVYDPCGSSCPPNCTHPNIEDCDCDQECNPGCFCQNGYVALEESCVEKKKCEACTGNRTYTKCGPPCSSTCNYKAKCPPHCTEGCFCKEDYIFLDDMSACVLPEDCPSL